MCAKRPVPIPPVEALAAVFLFIAGCTAIHTSTTAPSPIAPSATRTVHPSSTPSPSATVIPMPTATATPIGGAGSLLGVCGPRDLDNPNDSVWTFDLSAEKYGMPLPNLQPEWRGRIGLRDVSPSGHSVSFSVHEDGQFHFYVANANLQGASSQYAQLFVDDEQWIYTYCPKSSACVVHFTRAKAQDTELGPFDLGFSWSLLPSPDRSRVVLISTRWPESAITRLADGRVVTHGSPELSISLIIDTLVPAAFPVSAPPPAEIYVAWTADSKSFAYASKKEDGTNLIFRFDVASSQPSAIGEGQHPVWSVDGEHIFYVRHNELYRLSLSSGDETPMMAFSGGISLLSASPDGRYLAVGGFRDQIPPGPLDSSAFEIDLIQLPAGPTTVLPSLDNVFPGGFTTVRWSPDSRWFLVSTSFLFKEERFGTSRWFYCDISQCQEFMPPEEDVSCNEVFWLGPYSK